MSISISKDANSNYLAKVIEVKGLRKHPNADSLQVFSIDFQNVIVGLDTKDGDIAVYFPIESSINTNFLKFLNVFRDKELNTDKTQVGFFEPNGRVKAIKLRGEKSMGYVVPVEKVEEFTGKEISIYVESEFDTIGDILMVKKYVVPTKEGGMSNRQGKKPRISRLIEGQVHLHVETENLRKNAYRISPEDEISITYKLHGTSFWVANVPCKRKLNLFYKLLRAVGIKIEETEYDYIFGSRKVVKNQYETQHVEDFYDSDLWGMLKDEYREFVPKGYAFYGECVGYTKGGQPIQPKYDYGCPQGYHKGFIYRITFTNADGIVRELSTKDMQEWAEKAGFSYVPHFYTGKAKDLFPELSLDEHWNENFVLALEKKYTDKDCFMCKNVVAEEGIVARKEGLFEFESYKLKSWRFYEYETAMLDEGKSDIESLN